MLRWAVALLVAAIPLGARAAASVRAETVGQVGSLATSRDPSQWHRDTHVPSPACARAPPLLQVAARFALPTTHRSRLGSYFSLSQSRETSLQASLARVGRVSMPSWS